MAPLTHSVVNATQAWLQCTWHVQVPFAWLEACVDWLQEEAGGAARLSQQQINQQVLDQWLLTDLRDLDYPVLPEGLAQAQKTELNGTFCVQVDSLMDISQPAYGQLQKWRGTDCTNDEVSEVTQMTQRPWQSKSTRMLLLQVTDGVQSLEAMEYQSIPALGPTLRPGAKLQLQGQMVCRLGVLLLKPSNVKILGGEVDDLVERNNQGRVLCRTLGLPEDQQQEGEEVPSAPRQGNQEMEDQGLNDTDLLASLEAQGEVEMVEPALDSGYGTMQETASLSPSARSHVSSRSEISNRSQRSGLTGTNRSISVQRHHNRGSEGDPDLVEVLRTDMVRQNIQDHNMADQDFPDEDFDDLPLDELDSVVFQESENVISHPEASGTLTTATSKPSLSSTNLEPELQFVADDEGHFIDEEMDCLFHDVKAGGAQAKTAGGTARLAVGKAPGSYRDTTTSNRKTSDLSCRLTSKSSKTTANASQGTSYKSSVAGSHRMTSEQEPQSNSTVPPVTVNSPPFTYLCLLEELISKAHARTSEIRVKAFIVTLLGKLISSNGVWSVCATISDGTGYLDVELSNEVLTSLLGFSVAQKATMKRDPARRGELEAGMRRCQEELVDMCCIMTIVLEPGGRKAVVAKADPVDERVLQELEQRVRERKK